MYRQYEDPHKLEEQLKSAEEEYERLKEEYDDADCLVESIIEIESLKERINFAWQDEEYDENEGEY